MQFAEHHRVLRACKRLHDERRPRIGGRAFFDGVQIGLQQLQRRALGKVSEQLADAVIGFAGGLRTSLTFISQAALHNPAIAALGLRKPLEVVRNTRLVTKADMLHNDATPHIDVDTETYAVRADGELLVCEPAKVLPMAQRYFLF